MLSKRKVVKLETPQSVIELLKECSTPSKYPKHETNIVGIRHKMSKEDCINFIEDYELMKLTLKKCGYRISALWSVSLDETITKTRRGEELFHQKSLEERRNKRKHLKRRRKKLKIKMRR